MKLTVTKVEVYSDKRCVMVDCEGPRGGRYEWTVLYNRKGKATGAVETFPGHEFHPDLATVPSLVLEAANHNLRMTP